MLYLLDKISRRKAQQYAKNTFQNRNHGFEVSINTKQANNIIEKHSNK